MLPLLGLVAAVLVAATSLTVALARWDHPTPGKYTRPFFAAVALVVILGAMPAFIGFLLRKRWVPVLLVALYGLDVTIAIVATTGPLFFFVVAWSLTWSLYFLTSPRVKATFTE